VSRARAGACLFALALAGCAAGPPPPDWQLEARAALAAFERHYHEGSTRLAEAEFARARAELAKTGRGDLLARAELVRCAVRAASLELDDCPAFEALRAEAGPEERAYADYLAGRGARAAGEEPLARLVRAGVAFRAGRIVPAEIAAAIETASAQGWRRPLLAWLEVEARRAEAAGEREAAARLRRRIALVLGEGAAERAQPTR
jgi:hypothetical protein